MGLATKHAEDVAVTDIEKKLEDVRNKSAGYAQMYGRKEVADDRLKLVYAQLYADVPDHMKTVPERDNWIKRQEKYIDAIDEKQNAYADFKRAETYLKLLFAEVEVWRSKESTNRNVDKAHR